MKNLFWGLFCAFVSCPFLLIGLLFLLNSVRLTRFGVRVRGRVVGKCDESRAGDDVPYSIVEFTDESGVLHRHRLLGASSDDPPVGQRINLVYDPTDPKCVSGASFSQLWAAPVISCGLGAIGVVCGVLIATGVFPAQ